MLIVDWCLVLCRESLPLLCPLWQYGRKKWKLMQLVVPFPIRKANTDGNVRASLNFLQPASFKLLKRMNCNNARWLVCHSEESHGYYLGHCERKKACMSHHHKKNGYFCCKTCEPCTLNFHGKCVQVQNSKNTITEW